MVATRDRSGLGLEKTNLMGDDMVSWFRRVTSTVVICRYRSAGRCRRQGEVEVEGEVEVKLSLSGRRKSVSQSGS